MNVRTGHLAQVGEQGSEFSPSTPPQKNTVNFATFHPLDGKEAHENIIVRSHPPYHQMWRHATSGSSLKLK